MSTIPPTPASTQAPISALSDPAGCEDCLLVPGSLQRVRRMQALREHGWSLDEIALRFGVSRERVRQIMRAHGGPAPEDIADARRRRAEADAEARIDELLARWRSGRGRPASTRRRARG
ncbi:MAG TPA: sigma factor-like helix-turn-helix DNA-binding protein [Solirubrobacteraceae bacterium]|nr:sigma factor-like helix-turn-helix DNA-binding protein [Solirubrobacteraceae bacterium]